MTHAIQFSRAALRRLLRSPAFALMAILTLGIGVGANVAIFSVVHGVLLSPLPYPDAERLVGVWHTAPGIGMEQFESSDAFYLIYREHTQSLVELGAYRDSSVNLTGGEQPERVQAAQLTPSTFTVLGITPQLGRFFVEAEERPGAAPTVILGHGLWTRRYGADPDILGRTIRVDGVARDVVGVMPEDFGFPAPETDLWLPLVFDPSRVEVGNFNYNGIARLRPGVTPEAAAEDLTSWIHRLHEIYPNDAISPGMIEHAQLATVVHPLRKDLVGDVAQVLWTLLGSVGLILLIACANVANLFLARAEGRRQELAVRTALGATRGQLAATFLAESALLALVGGSVGLGLAAIGVSILRSLGPSSVPRLEAIGVDLPVLAYALAISLGAGLVSGAVAALRSLGRGESGLVGSGQRATGSRDRHRVRHALVVAQVGLALVLLVGSGLMARSFQKLRAVDPGFDSGGVLTLRLSLPEADYPDAETRLVFYDQLFDRLRTLPEVSAVGGTNALPMTGGQSNSSHRFEDFPLAEDEVPPILLNSYVSPDYFAALEIPLVAGRVFDRRDLERPETRPILVSEALAKRFWSGDSALGKRISRGMPDDEVEWSTVVGVVGGVRARGLDEPASEWVYYPLRTPGAKASYTPGTLSLAIRTGGDLSSLAAAARAAVWEIDPNLPVANVRTLEEILEKSQARTAFTLVLLGLAAAVAVLLGMVGLYGVIAYLVGQRTREIGVRMALGADRGAVRRMVLGQGLRLAAIGLGLGVLGALAVTRILASSLYGVSPTDPLTFVAVALFLLGIALAATWVPARRASALPPTEALRAE